MKFKDKVKQLPKSWYFLLTIIILYILISIFNQDIYIKSLGFFNQILLKILPIFILIFVLMTLSNYFVSPSFVIKHLKQKGFKKWVFVIIGGILSSGPIYMWYPLLADLKNKGIDYGLIACFLYNRAIKIPLIPLMLLYFSWKYIFILAIVMIFMSIIQGMLLNKLMEIK